MLIATSARVHSFLATLGGLTTAAGALLIVAGLGITLAGVLRRRRDGAASAVGADRAGAGAPAAGARAAGARAAGAPAAEARAAGARAAGCVGLGSVLLGFVLLVVGVAALSAG